MTMETLHENPAAAEALVPLAFPFTRGGYRHVLLARAGRVCLVERSSTHADSRSSVHYEVIVAQIATATTWPDGSTTPARARYPQAALWGSAAWTYTTHAAAERRFQDVVRARDGIRSPSPPSLPPPSSIPNPAPRAAASAVRVGEKGHSRRSPGPPPPPVRADLALGLSRRPVATVAKCALGVTVQLASGVWVQMVERGTSAVWIHEPGRGTREVALGTDVFAAEVPGA
jgi:hypothetical protein